MNVCAVILATPSAPYDVALLNCDGNSMVLNWKKPLHSGGAKVKEYYVDKRRSGTSVWREIHIPPVTERVYKVTPVYYLISITMFIFVEWKSCLCVTFRWRA